MGHSFSKRGKKRLGKMTGIQVCIIIRTTTLLPHKQVTSTLDQWVQVLAVLSKDNSCRVSIRTQESHRVLLHKMQQRLPVKIKHNYQGILKVVTRNRQSKIHRGVVLLFLRLVGQLLLSKLADNNHRALDRFNKEVLGAAQYPLAILKFRLKRTRHNGVEIQVRKVQVLYRQLRLAIQLHPSSRRDLVPE